MPPEIIVCEHSSSCSGFNYNCRLELRRVKKKKPYANTIQKRRRLLWDPAEFKRTGTNWKTIFWSDIIGATKSRGTIWLIISTCLLNCLLNFFHLIL